VETCADAGILGAVAGVVGGLMAAEALEVLAGRARGDRLCVYDALGGTAREVRLRRDPACAVCGDIRRTDAPERVFDRGGLR
jgi:adenylyltransferase/sulfurtransferase